MLVRGPGIADLLRGLLASAGLTYCSGGETVELVSSDDEGQVVVTDKTVYRGHPDAEALVEVGDELSVGQPVFDTVQVFELGSDDSVDLSSLQALVLGPKLANTANELVFPNIDGYFELVDGDARFLIYGKQQDIDTFWSTVAARGIEQGKTLAECVGLSETSGPIAVNPLKFVLNNVLGANLILVLVKPQHFLAKETGFLARVESLIPAGTLLMVQVELQPVSDMLDLSGSSETITLYNAMQPPTETISVTGTDLIISDLVPQVWIA